MKKLISLVASLSMMLSSVGASCFAESVNKENQGQTISAVEKNANQTLVDEKCNQKEAEKQKINAIFCDDIVSSVMQETEPNDAENRENAIVRIVSGMENKLDNFENRLRQWEEKTVKRIKSLNDKESWLKSSEEELKASENALKSSEEKLKASEDVLKTREEELKVRENALNIN